METEQPLTRRFTLGNFDVMAERNVIFDGEQEHRVAPKTMEVLMTLIRRYPDVVSAENIVAIVWGEQSNVDALLDPVMANLRSHLNDSVKTPQYIERVANKGYRLIAPLDVEIVNSKLLRRYYPWLMTFSIAVLAILGGWLWPQKVLLDQSVQRSSFEFSLQNESAPSLSPDKQFVVFSRFEQQSSDLFIRRLSQSQATDLVSSRQVNELSPTISPQGHQVAYFAVDGEGCQIKVIDLISRVQKQVTQCGADVNSWVTLQWSRNGQYLLTSRTNPATQRFEVVEYQVANGRVNRTIAPISTRQSFSKPSYSPDQQKVVFAAYDTLDRHWLLQVKAKEQPIKTLFKANYHIVDIKWLDGRIYYSVLNSANASGVWYYDLSTEQSVQITTNNTRFFDVSDDQTLLMTSEGASTINVWQYQMEAHQLTNQLRVTANRQFNHSPKKSPNGRLVSYVSNRSGNLNVWITPSNEQHALMVSRFKRGNIISHAWSPDSSALMISHLDNARYRLFTTKAGVDNLRELGVKGRDKKFGAWLADNKHIVWNEKIDGQWQLVEFDINTNTQRNIESVELAQLAAADNGDIFYVALGSTRLIRHNLINNQKTTVVLSDVEDFEQRQWIVKEPFVYVLTHQGRNAFLLQHQLNDGQLVHRWQIPQTVKPGSSFDIDVLKQHLLIPVLEELSSDLYLYRF